MIQTPITPQQRQVARRELVRQIEQGVSVQEARVSWNATEKNLKV